MLHGKITCFRLLAGFANAVVLTVPSTTVAQDALGAGNVLDANTNPASGGRNTAVRSTNYNSRNAVVTGNVIGGRGFRGTVGYAADRDFRGALGSDTLFDFRADSAFSQLALPGSLVGDSRTYSQVRFGQALGQIVYDRSGYTPRLQTDARQERAQWSRYSVDRQFRIDRMSSESSLDTSMRFRAEPTVIGQYWSPPDEDGNRDPRFTNVSSLRGVTTVSEQLYGAQKLKLGVYDMARLRNDIDAGRDIVTVGRAFQTVKFADVLLENNVADTRVDQQATNTAITAEFNSDYEKILQRIASRYAQQEDVEVFVQEGLLDQLDDSLLDLRRELVGLTRNDETSSTADTTAADRQRTGDPLATEKEIQEQDEESERIENLILWMRHNTRVDRIADADDESRFNELLKAGEELLREGEYFWAERRFLRAMRFMPGHPLATAGLAHAQLGAELNLSASITLRGLLTSRPEMIDVKYDPELMPGRVRLESAIDDMREMAKRSGNRANAGFLMAYIGHQLNQRQPIEEGLDLFQQAEPDSQLVSILRRIWLEEDDSTDDLDQ